VISLDNHLEEVEAITHEVKASTADEFSGILNSIIPELENRVAYRYYNLPPLSSGYPTS